MLITQNSLRSKQKQQEILRKNSHTQRTPLSLCNFHPLLVMMRADRLRGVDKIKSDFEIYFLEKKKSFISCMRIFF